jgi:hypothetical protein
LEPVPDEALEELNSLKEDIAEVFSFFPVFFLLLSFSCCSLLFASRDCFSYLQISERFTQSQQNVKLLRTCEAKVLNTFTPAQLMEIRRFAQVDTSGIHARTQQLARLRNVPSPTIEQKQVMQVVQVQLQLWSEFMQTLQQLTIAAQQRDSQSQTNQFGVCFVRFSF